jgi:hypothetical protein
MTARVLQYVRYRPSAFAVVLVVVLIVANLIVRPEFLAPGQIAPTLGTLAPFAIAGMASTPAFLSGRGGIDLSIAPLMGFTNISERAHPVGEIDLLHAGQCQRADVQGRRPVTVPRTPARGPHGVPGRRDAADDALYAGRPRRDHRCLCGLEAEAVGIRRQAYAGRGDRDVTEPAPHARQRLGLEVADRRSLCLGESAHPVLSEREVVDYDGRERAQAALDIRGAQAERGPQQRLIPPAPDRIEDRSDALGELALLVVVKIGGRCTTHDYVVNPNHNRYGSPRQGRQDRSWRELH